ncbi:MAG: hypothetical protein RBT74_13055 [Tenuifilaceae bacterium]|nr:hypothetical protein [Tenuifilaceae bacterium]
MSIQNEAMRLVEDRGQLNPSGYSNRHWYSVTPSTAGTSAVWA